jgi:hypothetical protein
MGNTSDEEDDSEDQIVPDASDLHHTKGNKTSNDI